MIYFCFIEGDAQHDVEMTLLKAVEDGPAMQEAGDAGGQSASFRRTDRLRLRR